MIPVFDLGDPKWDKGLVQRALRGELAAGGGTAEVTPLPTPDGSLGVDGAVLIAPLGTARTDMRLDHLQSMIAGLDWVVILGTSDEGSKFPWRELKHPNMRLWIQTPRPELHYDHDRFLVHGPPQGTWEYFAGFDQPAKDVGWSFMGQVNHERRQEMIYRLRDHRMPPGFLLETEGFTQGLPRHEYLDVLAKSKLALCPSGPVTPDSFRTWEALEAGGLPIVDDRCPAYGPGYWPLVLGEVPPFPLIEDWANVKDFVDHHLSRWPFPAVEASAWWQRHKRNVQLRIWDDVREVSGLNLPDPSQITVLIPTSPIASHPSTSIIEETVASVRHWLPTAEIIVMCDGVREEQESYRTAYGEYLERVAWLCNYRWGNAYPLYFGEHTHQIGMTRRALEDVRTSLLLFVEHDTPLVTDEDIDWGGAIWDLGLGFLNVLRLHHEALVLEVHERLMIDHETNSSPIGLPFRRTLQWSQRPHLARTDYYRSMMERLKGRKGMIEDHWHGFVQTEPWGAHRVALYHPPGKAGIKRSLNLDGRGDDPKWVDS